MLVPNVTKLTRTLYYKFPLSIGIIVFFCCILHMQNCIKGSYGHGVMHNEKCMTAFFVFLCIVVSLKR